MKEDFDRLLKIHAKLIGEIHEIQQSQIRPLELKVQEVWELIKLVCPHENTEKKSRYSPGSYYDREAWYEWDECVICNTRSEERESLGGYG